MFKLLIIACLCVLPCLAFAQVPPPCVDMSGNYKDYKNSNKMTLVQKGCESLEIQDPRGEFTLLIMDGVRREVPNNEGNITFATARFVSEDSIDVDWETFYNGSATALKFIRKLTSFEMTTTVLFLDRYYMVKPDGSLALLFEENWVKE
jgi:hypothetical protein